MKIFKDEALTQEVEVLDLGILPAGETKEYSFWVFNDTNADLKKIEFSIEHEEVKIIVSPDKISPKSSAELIIEWRPNITLKEGLKTELKFKAIELWRP